MPNLLLEIQMVPLHSHCQMLQLYSIEHNVNILNSYALTKFTHLIEDIYLSSENLIEY